MGDGTTTPDVIERMVDAHREEEGGCNGMQAAARVLLEEMRKETGQCVYIVVPDGPTTAQGPLPAKAWCQTHQCDPQSCPMLNPVDYARTIGIDLTKSAEDNQT